VKIPVVIEKIAKLAAFVSFVFPGDLGEGACPVEIAEERPGGLAHGPVETGVVSDDKACAGHEGFDRRRVDRVSGDIAVRDASNGGDRRRDRLGRLLKLIEGIENPADAAFRAVFEPDHAEFDHFVGAGRQSCGFRVEDDAGEGVDRRIAAKTLLGRQPAQHPVIAGCFEHGSEAIEEGIDRAVHGANIYRIWPYRGRRAARSGSISTCCAIRTWAASLRQPWATMDGLSKPHVWPSAGVAMNITKPLAERIWRSDRHRRSPLQSRARSLRGSRLSFDPAQTVGAMTAAASYR
jgi:hypothetical protein